jgi:hypothetical protein
MEVKNVSPSEAEAYIKLASVNLSSVCVSLIPVLTDPAFSALVADLKSKADAVANYSNVTPPNVGE